MNKNIDNKEVEKYNKEQSKKMDMGDGWIRIDDSVDALLEGTEWLDEKFKSKITKLNNKALN